MAGANLIYGAGMLEAGMTLNYGTLVMDNEIISLIKQFVRGVEVNDETLAVEEILAVGSQGDFLGTDHTFRHMKDATSPVLVDRRVRVEWEAEGATDMYQRSLVRARELAAEYKPLPLGDDVVAEMHEVVLETERCLETGAALKVPV